MTVNATATRELTIDEIVLRSYNLAGLVSAGQALTLPQASLGRDLLEVTVDHLQSFGFAARAIDFATVPLVDGTYKYTLAATVQETVDPAMFIPSTSSTEQVDGETIVSKVGREVWQTQSAKGASGRPNIYYEHRASGVVQVWFWPVPGTDEAGKYVRLQIHRLLGDNDDGTKTVDLERYWVKCLLYWLAHDLAVAQSLPDSRCLYLKGLAQQALDHARAQSRDSTDVQMHIAGRRRW